MMITALLQERTLRITSIPSISGSPRSRRIRSGFSEEQSEIAWAPLAACIYSYSWIFRVVVIRFMTGRSSSTTRIFMSFILDILRFQGEYKDAAVGHIVMDGYGAAMGLHDHPAHIQADAHTAR